MTRADAVLRTLTTLRFFWESPQGKEKFATGYKGFFYHFIDMKTGRRAWKSELSSIDTAFFLAGALAAAQYFDQNTEEEKEIRTLGDALYRRADWKWMLNGGETLSMGWKPERGFLKYRWEGYSEALILYALGLGSPTFPLPAKCYQAWLKTYQWKKFYNIEFLYAGPLFIHQLSHLWIDFRNLQDEFMRDKGIDYFENSRRATYVQQQYAILNPKKFKGYEMNCWGITASDGPGPATQKVNGKLTKFYDYIARKIPNGPDDGTIAPWAAFASLPFAPEIVLPALDHFTKNFPDMIGKYGFDCSFNPTFESANQGPSGWISKGCYGLNQGPIVLMTENYRTGFFWQLMRDCPYITAGLRRADFTGGWL
ncbi:MAG: glucoamylase family protein [Sulfuriferula sp.]